MFFLCRQRSGNCSLSRRCFEFVRCGADDDDDMEEASDEPEDLPSASPYSAGSHASPEPKESLYNAPRCGACKKSVFVVEEVNALGRSWHNHCFVCKVCGKFLRNGMWKEHEGLPYCASDYDRLFGILGYDTVR